MKQNECPDSHAANGVHWQASMILQQVKSRLIEMPEEIDKLKQTLSRRTDRSGIKERCAVILASLDGSSIKQISKRLSKSRQYVKRWLRRFITNG
ncbi:helix-turn-helix domain-containing protein, partial [Anaerobiospirillum succiniciproducens]